MPTSVSAKKRLRQNITRRGRNRSTRQTLRTQCRKVREAIEASDIQQAETEFQQATKKLDRAVAGNILHKNAAARLKSRMSAKIKVLKAG